MRDKDKTKDQLLNELSKSRRRIAALEKLKNENKRTEEEFLIKDLAIKSAISAIALADLEGKLTYVNDSFLKLWDYKNVKEVLGKPSVKFWQTEEKAMEVVKALRNKGSLIGELTAIKKDGSTFDVQLSASMVIDETSKPICMMASFMDITERKMTEETIRESEKNYKELADSISDVFFEMDKDLKYTYWNKASENLTGISADQALGKSLYDVFPNVKGTKAAKLYLEALRTHKSKSFVNEYQLNGKNFFFEINAYPSKRGLSVFVKDITERRQAEKVQTSVYKISEAAHSAENLDDLYHSIHNTITELMPAKNFYIALYDRASELISFPYFVDENEENPGSQNLGKGLTEYVLKTGKPLLASPEVFDELVKKGEVESVGPPSIDWLGIPLKTRNKTIGVLTVQSYTEGVRYSEKDKDILTFISEQVAMAIEHKRTEEALRDSEEKFRNLAEQSPNMIFINHKGRVVYANKRCEEIMGYKKGEFYSPDFDFLSLIASEHRDKVKVIFNRHMKGKEAPPYDYSLTTKEGKRIDGILTTKLISYEADRAILGIVTDITERKKAEEEIKASLKEKEVLLKEIHHRVKNNMQITSSLLNLQSRYIKDKQAQKIFKDSQNRVKSMSLIHERLYQSKNLSKIDFAEYALSLTRHLFSSHGINPRKIKYQINIKNVLMDISSAIPCGLIINELVSNSLKHAFTDGKKGEIKIAMHRFNPNEIQLIVSDNGVSLPDEIDFRNTKSLGLHLVTLLAEDQLKGDIRLDRKKGTKFQMRLRIKQ